jgi:hypothetical protein
MNVVLLSRLATEERLEAFTEVRFWKPGRNEKKRLSKKYFPKEILFRLT